MAFEYLQRRRLHTHSDLSVPMLCHPQNKLLSSFLGGPFHVPVFNHCFSFSCFRAPLSRAWLPLLAPPFSFYRHLIPSQSPFPEAQPFLLIELLQPLNHVHSPPQDLIQDLHVSLLVRSPELDLHKGLLWNKSVHVLCKLQRLHHLSRFEQKKEIKLTPLPSAFSLL